MNVIATAAKTIETDRNRLRSCGADVIICKGFAGSRPTAWPRSVALDCRTRYGKRRCRCEAINRVLGLRTVKYPAGSIAKLRRFTGRRIFMTSTWIQLWFQRRIPCADLRQNYRPRLRGVHFGPRDGDYRPGYHCSVDSPGPRRHTLDSMDVELTYEQRARVELIAIHSCKTPAQVLVDASQFLLNCEIDYYPPRQAAPSQQFLPEEELEARFARLLGR